MIGVAGWVNRAVPPWKPRIVSQVAAMWAWESLLTMPMSQPAVEG